MPHTTNCQMPLKYDIINTTKSLYSVIIIIHNNNYLEKKKYNEQQIKQEEECMIQFYDLIEFIISKW